MRDVRGDLSSLWQRLSLLEGREGARAIMFIGCEEGIGTTSLAASFALLAAQHAERTAWLFDLDISRNAAFHGFRKQRIKNVGPPGRALDGSLHQEPIYRLKPAPSAAGGADNIGMPGVAGGKLLAVHQIEGTRLLVTRFAHERLEAGQRAELIDQPDWWAVLRRSADWVIVDAPSLSRSRAGITLAHQVDGVIIVMDSPRTSPGQLMDLQNRLEAEGAMVLGVVMVNR